MIYYAQGLSDTSPVPKAPLYTEPGLQEKCTIMKKIAKLRTVLLLLSIFLIIVVLGVALREKKRPIVVNREALPEPQTDASLELNNVAYTTLGADNFKLWDLNAKTARIF